MHYFLTPSYWGFKSTQPPKMDQTPHKDDDEEVDDVKRERNEVYRNDENVAVKLINLVKVYRSLPWQFWNPVVEKLAVNRLCLALKEGSLLALLGQNGAGKTTTMNMLSGSITATSGEALLYGRYLSRDVDDIRKITGCCPQHDVLFNDMTAREHIEFYAGIKGIRTENIQGVMEERYEQYFYTIDFLV